MKPDISLSGAIPKHVQKKREEGNVVGERMILAPSAMSWTIAILMHLKITKPKNLK